jgi:hypothetical protein
MRKAVYLERIKRLTKDIGEGIDSLSKELYISDSPEAIELRNFYSIFAKKANSVAPKAYPKNKDMMGGLYDLLAETKQDEIEGRAELKKKLGRA